MASPRTQTGNVEPRTDFLHGPAPKSVMASMAVLKGLVTQNRGATNEVFATLMAERTGIYLSALTVSGASAVLGWTRKEWRFVATEADPPRVRDFRTKWAEWAPPVDPARILLLDEAGSTIAMAHEYARAPRGERTNDRAPRNRGAVTTILGALTPNGLDAVMTIQCGTDGDVYAAFLEQVLTPKFQPGDLGVVDHAGAHKGPRVHEVLARRGAEAIYLPPYSPGLNPIELAGSKLEGFLRTAAACSVDALDTEIAEGREMIPPEDPDGWFGHRGYAAKPTYLAL